MFHSFFVSSFTCVIFIHALIFSLNFSTFPLDDVTQHSSQLSLQARTVSWKEMLATENNACLKRLNVCSDRMQSKF